jgi:recombination protein RecA
LAKKTKAPVSLDLDLSLLAGDTGLVLLKDSDYAMVFDRLPLFMPRIDKVFGGGLPFGRMVEIAGKPSGGKSTISYHAARVATRLGCIVVLIDVEGTADRVRLAQLGIDVSKVLVKQPDPEKKDKNGNLEVQLTVEEVGRTIEQTINIFHQNYPNTRVVYIWDSVGQTPSEDEVGKDFGDKNVGARAKAITQFVTKIGPLISETKSLLIGINQVRDSIGGNPMFPQYSVPGGNAWEHYASLRLEIQKKNAIKKSEEKIGHIMGVHVRKSKVSRPFQIANGFLISDNGMDYEFNLLEMAKESKIVNQSGANYVYVDRFGTEHKKKHMNFVDWLKTEEGQPVREELLNRLILVEYPDGKYPALENKTLDISGWIDKIIPLPVQVADSAAEAPADDTDDLMAQLQEEIQNGE